ncbi:MAG: DUF6427 family protein [Bacteroidota bacterium]|nr:DUF6427 family protein [Bacteroidota bacterium]
MVSTLFGRSQVSALYLAALLGLILFILGFHYQGAAEHALYFGPWEMSLPRWLDLFLGSILAFLFPLILQRWFQGEAKFYKPHMYLPLIGVIGMAIGLASNFGTASMILLFIFTALIYATILPVLNQEPIHREANIALLFGLSIHIFPGMWIYMILFIISLMIYGQISFKTLFVLFLGTLAPFYFSWATSFLLDSQQTYDQWVRSTLFTLDHISMPGIEGVLLPLFTFGFWIILSFTDFFATLSRAKINKRQGFILFGLSVVIGVMGMGVAGLQPLLITVSLPLILIFTNTIQYVRRSWWIDLLVIVSLAVSVSLNFLTF